MYGIVSSHRDRRSAHPMIRRLNCSPLRIVVHTCECKGPGCAASRRRALACALAGGSLPPHPHVASRKIYIVNFLGQRLGDVPLAGGANARLVQSSFATTSSSRSLIGRQSVSQT
jgi:hypothetical protein